MVTGRILQFDHARGYGFVGADDGGEDVFLHASVFDGDPEELAPGTKMEFKVMAGDRGRKAFAARLIDDEPEHDLAPPPRPVSPPQPVLGPRPGQAPPLVSSSGPTPPPPPSGLTPPPSSRPAPPPSPPLTAQVKTVTAAHAPANGQGPEQGPEDEQMCDVLSPAEFGQELTELLLTSVPSLTGRQVLEVRQSMLESAKKHGWVDM